MLIVKPFFVIYTGGVRMTVKGKIHSFESFGTVDGPGIRFVVFMQGCPLKCLYCHNRDTWDTSGGNEYTVDEVLNQLRKYKNYFERSGGGITISGGEPTLQPEFVEAVFKDCREMGIHTALDTSGHTDIEKVRGLLQYTDLVLLDIKHAVNEKHKLITGVGNDKTKSFARYLSENNIPVWIRYVLLPGYTDGEDDLQQAAGFIRELKTVEKIEVLPYHSMGAFKWKELGCEYKLEDVKEPTEEEVARAEKILTGHLMDFQS